MIEKKNVPNHWEIKKLGEVADYINGRAFRPTEWEKTGKPIIRIQNLNKAEAGYNYSNQIFEDKYLIDKGDLLYAWSASLGVYIWNGGKAWLNQHIFKVIPKDICNKKYLFYTLEKITSEIYAKTHGSGMVHVTKGKFEETEIPFPSLTEQQAIVSKIEELLSDLENGILQLQTALQQLKIYRQSLLKYAFEGRLTNPDVKLGELPKGWKWVSIKEIGKIKGGKRLPPKHQYSEIPTNYIYIMAGNLKNGTVTNRVTYIKEETYKALENYKVSGGEVYITIVGACIGDAGVIPENIGKSILTENAAKIIELNNIRNKYLAFWINSLSCQMQIKNKILSATLGKLALNRIGTLELPLPPLNEQQIIVDELESKLTVCDKLEETVTKSLLQAESLKQSILKKAFEGKLV